MQQSSRVWPAISMMVGNAASFLADQLREGAVEFHFARRIGAVAELVLEPQDADRVALLLRRPARQQEAAQALGRLRQHQEGVAHRRRQKPFVAVQAKTAVARRLGARRVGAQIRAALVLGHAHADERGGLLPQRPEALVVVAPENLRQPLRRDRRRMAQARHRAVGHGERAISTALDLVEHVAACGARDMRAWFRIGPGARMQAGAQRDGHERVPGRMEVDFVEAMAVAVEGAQGRRDICWRRNRAARFPACRAWRRARSVRLPPSPPARARPPRAARYRW